MSVHYIKTTGFCMSYTHKNMHVHIVPHLYTVNDVYSHGNNNNNKYNRKILHEKDG